MRVGYFPGCSLHATSREYAESVLAMTGALGVELFEIEDWACCGATSAHATNHLLGVALPARTLALAAEQGHEQVLAPCAACFNRLAAARHELRKDPKIARAVENATGRPIQTNVNVLSIVKLLQDLKATIREKTVRPLKGLKAACYYGCLLARPKELTDLDDVEMPSSMEDVVKATGATPVAWNRRLDCCGGGFSLSRTSSVVRLSRTILEDARDAGADLLVVACPMCHSNLDFRQKAIAKRAEDPTTLPILFLSQVVGLALGEGPLELGLDRHFVTTEKITSCLPEIEEQKNVTTGEADQ